MFYLWVYFGDRGKDFYLPDAKNWTGELPLNQADTRWDSDVVIPVRALDGQWFITPAQGFKWRNGRDAGEREMCLCKGKEKVARPKRC